HRTRFCGTSSQRGTLFHSRGAADVRSGEKALARSVMAGDSVEFLPELYIAGRIPGWLSRGVDFANGGEDRSIEVPQARAINRGPEKHHAGGTMIPMLVDLEHEWRGGQNQFFLLLKGLHERGHAAEL